MTPDQGIAVKRQGKGVFLAVGISYVIGKDDVKGASGRSAILTRAMGEIQGRGAFPSCPL
ncbi:hypothetical protein [Verrucomicrobium sp. 3C]|uniref:hypothetical protein n=1 Tax=Verrucomicrobium sp. 3C TaxID=1134055 RepID=UPI00036C7C6B|nr:hypothetical protein [Verrucomicrobium sp. 3C]